MLSGASLIFRGPEENKLSRVLINGIVTHYCKRGKTGKCGGICRGFGLKGIVLGVLCLSLSLFLCGKALVPGRALAFVSLFFWHMESQAAFSFWAVHKHAV